jgi:hemoglobin
MVGIHAGQGADADLGERFVECFVQAADDAGLPDDPDFRSGMRSYMEWAVRDVLAYSPCGTAVSMSMAMPRWSWDGLEVDSAGP